MAHIKQLLNRAYISTQLKEKLSSFEQYRYNFICAPTGYGKSMVCRTFFKNYPGYTILWIDANTSKEIFWTNLCNAIKMVSPTHAAQFAALKFPENEDDVNELCALMSNLTNERAQTLVVIDNFDDVFDEQIASFLKINYAATTPGLKYVFLVHELFYQDILSLIAKNEIGCIEKNELSFKPEDIYDYYRLNEFTVDLDTAKEIYSKTNGWPYIVELFMHKDTTKVNVLTLENLNNFIEMNVWYNLDDSIKDFLINLSVFHKFTISQCITQTKLDEKTCLDYLHKVSLIDYDRLSRTYTFNPIFAGFLQKVFHEKPIDEIKEITMRAADTYLSNSDYYHAIRLYNKSEEYGKIYTCDASLGSLYKDITRENKDMFFNIANQYWKVNKKGKYQFSIIMCFAMFLYNEKNIMETLINDIENDIKDDDLVDEIQKNSYLAEIQYIKAFFNFNDFNKMNEDFKKVTYLTKSPVNITASHYPFSFESPSIMALYHRRIGGLDVEMFSLEDCAPNYYRITNGHGKGFEALMKAEALYNKGEIDGAEILCHKVIYMADSRNQHDIYIAANFLMARISIYHGANDAFKEYMNNIDFRLTSSEEVAENFHKMVEVCKAFIYTDLEEVDKIENWLKNEKTIEDKANFISLSYVNVALCKYLIIDGQYHHFLGISGQLIGLSKLFSYIVPRIYIYIFLSIANNGINDKEKGKRFLLEAMELAVHDKIIMPFVQNYSRINELLDEIAISKTLSPFVKSIHKYAKNYEKGTKTIKKAGRILADYGLTVREADVAKLAAQRLTNKEIAEQLFIAESTVKSNMKVIFNKLGINSRSDLKNFFE